MTKANHSSGRFVSIRWILPAAIVIPVLAVAVILIVLSVRTGRENATDLASQNARNIHHGIESRLNQLMSLPPAVNRMNEMRLREGMIALDNPGPARSRLFLSLQAFPDVSGIVLASAKGHATWVIRYPGETSYEYAIKASPDAPMQEYTMAPDGAIGAEPIRSFDYDPTARPWYQAAMQSADPTWGPVYTWVRGGKPVTLGFSRVEVIRDAAGAALGVINCEVTLSDICAFLKHLEIGKTGLAFIIERNGDLVANSVGVDGITSSMGRMRADEAPDRRIAAAAAALPGLFGPLASIEGVYLRNAVIDGTPSQVAVSSFQSGRNLNWLIVTLIPDSDFLTRVENNRARAVRVSSAAVAITLLLGIGIAIWLVKPLLAVVAHARRVGSGDLQARINRRENREVAQLSESINEMADGLQDRLRLQHALALAMEVQQSLLPVRTPRVKGLDIAARSKYCDETGGDYYDYLDVAGMSPHSVMIALGDVTGHGIAAAMLMATARGMLRSQVRTAASLGHLLTIVNEHLVVDTGGTRFMTMFLGVIDVEGMSMRWASAGHDQPIIYTPSGGHQTEIDPQGGGLPLGILESEVYQEHAYSELRPGQVMLIGTDGLWEAKNHADEQFGKQRVAEALAAFAHLSAAEIEAGVYQQLQEFCHGRPNGDDITYVVVKFTGPV
jgi:sigma-B regulation protein RsbU (phosphoserine phosphatase)